MSGRSIIISGAKTHNLKNISLEIPKDRVVVFTGVSGSGKSSLVFDTIYTEAQRQLVETFSSFARRRLPKLSRPPVESISNISTAIVIDQKKMGGNLRSTVGTATEIYTYLRLLFSRFGEPFIGWSHLFSFNHPEGMCPDCKGLGKRIRVDSSLLIDREKSIREGAITHPDFKVDGWNWRELTGIGLFDVDKKMKDFSREELDALLYSEGVPVSKKHGGGVYTKKFEGIARKLERYYINKAGDELPEERQDAYDRYFLYADCPSCGGVRINERARSVRFHGKTIPDLVNMELSRLNIFLSEIVKNEASPLIEKMGRVLSDLTDIGVGYLSLNRAVCTLSGGESQRVKMARQLDCDLVDMIYILDEPSVGLHPRDTDRLVGMLKKLKDKGNSVLVVEHDPAVIMSADHAVDIGPFAGEKGGKVLYSGNVSGLAKSDTVTGKFLREGIGGPAKRRPWKESFQIREAKANNLKNVTVTVPKNVLTCVTGVAGSGKSSLVHECFVRSYPESIVIDQSPAGRSSRSNPATYIGVFDMIRKEIASSVKKDPSLFSFNSKGACPKCKGSGTVSIEMNFLDDVKMVCEDCKGMRYRDEVLEIKYNGKNIFEILSMTASESLEFFKNPEIGRRLGVLDEVGLGYMEIGQSLSSLSGGEAQRIKIATELQKKGSIFVMDEPTTGLHMADISRLIGIINRLVDNGNTVIVIEHNLDVIRQADWVIDMGPEGGSRGGEILAEGTPEDIIRVRKSFTGRYLKKARQG